MAVVQDTQTDLLTRAGDLKGELVAFGQGPRCAEDLQRALRRRSTEYALDTGENAVDFLDWFVLSYHGRDGRTILERFIATRSDLPDTDRELLLTWRDVLDGVFEIAGREGRTVVAVSLLDDLTYRLTTNTDPAVLRPMKKRHFLVTRAVPIGGEWMLSGAQRLFEPSARQAMFKLAANLAVKRPDLVFRNPAKLEQGWKQQHRDREWFIKWWGRDLVVLDGEELAGRFAEYWRWRVRQTAEGELPDQPVPTRLEMPVPADVAEMDTVAVLNDELEGMHFLPEFGTVQETFANPRLLADRDCRESVLHYLNDDAIPPAAIRRLAERDPGKTSVLFERLLKKRGFSWARDGERLLRSRKAAAFARPCWPSMVPISRH